MFYVHAYDEKEEKFYYILLFNLNDMKVVFRNGQMNIPLPKSKTVHEIKIIYHSTAEESIEYLKKMNNNKTEFLDDTEDYFK